MSSWFSERATLFFFCVGFVPAFREVAPAGGACRGFLELRFDRLVYHSAPGGICIR